MSHRACDRSAPGGAALWTWPGYAAMGAAALLSLGSARWAGELGVPSLLAGLVLFGIPHGAVDHLVPGWARRQPLPLARLAVVMLLYGLAAGLALGVWWLDPALALVGFFLITVWHWGNAELAFFPGQPRRLSFALARGCIPMFTGMLAAPTAFDRAVGSLFSPFLTHRPFSAPTGTLRLDLVIALGLLSLAGAGRGWRARLELAGLVLGFAVTQPVLAIGVYFIFWHSWRHLLRLSALRTGRGAAADSATPREVGAVLVAALPCSIIALGALAGLVGTSLVTAHSAPQLAGAELALIAALTVPHCIVVLWLDIQEGTLRTPRRVHPSTGIPRPTPAPDIAGFPRGR